MSPAFCKFGVGLGCLLLGAVPAVAGDGVREINQACAAVGCWPGDDPGLPVRIVEKSSYRLTSGLVVDANTTAIEVAADDVTIDLNGFTIRGPAIVTPGAMGLECSDSGSGYGILGEGLGSRTTVRNGSVVGIAGPGGIRLGGGSRVVEVSVENICGDGIVAGITSSVTESRSRLCAGSAVQVGDASRVAGVIADFNTVGIVTGSSSLVSNSIATTNQLTGVLARGGSVVSGCSTNHNGLRQYGDWWELSGIGAQVGYGPILVVGNFSGWNPYYGFGGVPYSGFGGNVFHGNSQGGAADGVPTQCNVANGVTYCPSHP